MKEREYKEKERGKTMGTIRVLTTEEIKEYERLTKEKVKAIENKKGFYELTSINGKIYSKSGKEIIKRLSFQKIKELETKQRKAIDLTNFKTEKQVKKEWKAISCSMTLEELAVIDKVMKANQIKTYNKFLRLLLLKVIEANK